MVVLIGISGFPFPGGHGHFFKVFGSETLGSWFSKPLCLESVLEIWKT